MFGKRKNQTSRPSLVSCVHNRRVVQQQNQKKKGSKRNEGEKERENCEGPRRRRRERKKWGIRRRRRMPRWANGTLTFRLAAPCSLPFYLFVVWSKLVSSFFLYSLFILTSRWFSLSTLNSSSKNIIVLHSASWRRKQKSKEFLFSELITQNFLFRSASGSMLVGKDCFLVNSGGVCVCVHFILGSNSTQPSLVWSIKLKWGKKNII